jgi:hypothetical protein
MSISTGAPAALALSDGANVLTKGSATAAVPTPPATEVAISHLRRLLSMLCSLITEISYRKGILMTSIKDYS